MTQIISAVLIIATIIGAVLFYLNRKSNLRQAAELSRVAALPLDQRLEELFRARVQRSTARFHLRGARSQFNRSWGYRHNPAFSRLIVARAEYESATGWVRKIEALCGVSDTASQ